MATVNNFGKMAYIKTEKCVMGKCGKSRLGSSYQ